jgi:hypothetical protein
MNSGKSLVERLRTLGVPVTVFQHVVELQNTARKEVADDHQGQTDVQAPEGNRMNFSGLTHCSSVKTVENREP